MRKKHLLFICTLAITVFFACKKGDTGPEGPQGATGSQGPQGPVGSQGPQGQTGSANVIYSEWLSVTAGEWKDTTMTNITRAQRVLKAASALTQPILDSGVILVYMKDVESRTFQLPFTYNISPARVHGYIPTLGKFVFYEYSTDGTGGVTSTANKYRYIIIPGGVKTGRTSEEWTKMSYKEVCKTFQISE